MKQENFVSVYSKFLQRVDENMHADNADGNICMEEKVMI